MARSLCTTRSDIRRWTTSIAELLASEEGQREYKEFLEIVGFEQDRIHLDFYNECQLVINSPDPLLKAQEVKREYVDMFLVNLDVGVQEEMNRAVRERRITAVRDVFTIAQSKIRDLLFDSYNAFVQHLLQRQQTC